MAKKIQAADVRDNSLNFTNLNSTDPTVSVTGENLQISHTDTTPIKTKIDTLASAITQMYWQASVKDNTLSAPPGSPTTGDRYIVKAPGTYAWTGYDNQIAQWNGTIWIYFMPLEGWVCEVDIDSNVYLYNAAYPSGVWVNIGATVVHNDLLGLQGGTPGQYYHLTSTEHGYINQDVKNYASPTFAGLDLTGFTGVLKATAGVVAGSANLADLNDVLVSSPLVNQTFQYNGAKWINGNPVNTSASNGVLLYLDDTHIRMVGVNNNDEVNTLLGIPNTIPQVIDSISVTGGNTLYIQSYLYNTGLGSTQIDAGEWTFDTYAAIDVVGNIPQILINANRVVDEGILTVTTSGIGTSRNATASGGTPFDSSDASVTIGDSGYLMTPQGLYEITSYTSPYQVTISVPSTYSNEVAVAFNVWKKLFQVASGQIGNIYPALQLYSIISTQPAYSINSTDQLGVVYFATKDTGGSTTVYYSHNGTDNYSHIHTPLVTKHNDLAGLQGGITNQYYHLTLAQYGYINQDVTTTANPTFNSITLVTTVGIKDTSGHPWYTYFQGGSQTANINYTLPVTNTNGLLRNTAGVWSWDGTNYQSTTLADTNIWVGNGSNVATAVSVSGDVSMDDTGKFTIPSGNITLAKMANLAANSFIGNNTAIPATPIALTYTQVKAALGYFTSIGDISLTSANIIVGNVSNVAAAVTMSGDVSITNLGATTVNTVGTSSAANIHSAELAANAATSSNTISTIVKRDGSGNFSAGTITASITGAASLNVLTSVVGYPNGVASLDGGGKIPVTQLPSAVMEYQGAWDASTNTPTLLDLTPAPGTAPNINGYTYRSSSQGTVDFNPSGIPAHNIVTFQVGDFCIYSGTLSKWQCSPAADGVTSVDGMQGAVSLSTHYLPLSGGPGSPMTGNIVTQYKIGGVSLNNNYINFNGDLEFYRTNAKVMWIDVNGVNISDTNGLNVNYITTSYLGSSGTTTSIEANGNYSTTGQAGVYSHPSIAISSTFANMYAYQATASLNLAGALTNLYDLYITDATGTGTVTNQYGVYVGSLAKGGTLNYAVYTAGSTPSSFGGNVSVGNLVLAETTSSTTGIIFKGANSFIHNYGTKNTLIGEFAGNFTLTGSNNTGIGYNALTALTSSSDNTALGYNALAAIAGGLNYGNTAIGSGALQTCASGSGYSVAVGYGALKVLNGGSANTALGAYSLYATTTGISNTAIGYNALNSNVSGGTNTAVGQFALAAVTGNGNVALGNYAGAYETGSNAFYINNIDQTNTATEKANSLMYGVFGVNAAAQTLNVNATFNVNGFSAFGDGGTTNYTAISSTGGVSYYGLARPQKSIVLTAAGGWPSTTNGCSANTLVESATNYVDTYFLDFAHGSSTYAQWTVVMPEAWDGGTITAVFYWTANDTTTNAVVWDIQGRSYGNGNLIDQTWGTAQSVTSTNSGTTAYKVNISSATAVITLAGSPSGGQLVQFRVYRDGANGSDTMTTNARLMSVKLKYTIYKESD